jgi:hypothetical protein
VRLPSVTITGPAQVVTTLGSRPALDVNVQDSMTTSVSEARTTALEAQLPAEHRVAECCASWRGSQGAAAGRVHVPEKVEFTKETLPPVTLSTVPMQVLLLKIEFLTVTCTAQL